MRHTYLLLFSLYWAQGLPVGFMTHALPVILRSQGVSLAHIGGFGLLMAPWAIKILWAPFVDSFGHDSKGHYRSWIIPTQLLTIAILTILSFLPIQSLNEPIYLLLFFMALLCMNSVGATQDIATDGLAVSILKGDQQHIGNMIQVIGSRLGFIVGGGAILWAMDWLSWQSTFLILAGIVALNTIPICFYHEPKHLKKTALTHLHDDATQHFIEKLKSYLTYFFVNKKLRAWFFVLCSIKITDGFTGPITKPLLVDLQLSLSQIGIYITMLGAFSALLGAGLASLMLKNLKRQQALILFSILKLISLAGFVWLAAQYEQSHFVAPWLIYLINALEDLFAAMLLVIILTLVMQYSRQEYAGTDFTFQVSIMATISGLLYTLSGMIGDQLGYFNYLSLILVIGIFCQIPIIYWIKKIRHS
ncbi:MFS transporter [Acinetobacter sp. ULE_I001]|jgi:MFS transporter, PAT family, beta-lactamase induction signal transducer AmpG|uniref:MFS transporter n=1 Tax=unclassified Acinetobacter TaxID=196816 RepID=UPI003019A27D